MQPLDHRRVPREAEQIPAIVPARAPRGPAATYGRARRFPAPGSAGTGRASRNLVRRRPCLPTRGTSAAWDAQARRCPCPTSSRSATASYSSWSLRGWLLFAQVRHPGDACGSARLYSPEIARDAGARTSAARARCRRSASRRRARDFALWDTLAIAETLAERHPERGLWPERAGGARAGAHAGGGDACELRARCATACPMNLRRAYVGFAPDAAVRADLARIEALWALARAAHGGGGPWLFGAYSLADVFFAPVAARVATYGLPVGAGGDGLRRRAPRRPGLPRLARRGARRPLRAGALRPRPAGAGLAGPAA